MPRVKRGTKRRANRKKTLALAQDSFSTKSKLYRAAQEAVERSLRHGYIGRKHKKRDFRSLWIVRINAACRTAGISYSKFMDGLKKAGIDLNRKVLADIAATDEAGFRALVERAQRRDGSRQSSNPLRSGEHGSNADNHEDRRRRCAPEPGGAHPPSGRSCRAIAARRKTPR